MFLFKVGLLQYFYYVFCVLSTHETFSGTCEIFIMTKVSNNMMYTHLMIHVGVASALCFPVRWSSVGGLYPIPAPFSAHTINPQCLYRKGGLVYLCAYFKDVLLQCFS